MNLVNEIYISWIPHIGFSQMGRRIDKGSLIVVGIDICYYGR
jgi:hypothetical protein